MSERENLPSISPSLNPSIVSYSPEQVVIDVAASRDGYLVLTDAYYPGWVATIDGQPANIERADILFRAVKVPAGSASCGVPLSAAGVHHRRGHLDRDDGDPHRRVAHRAPPQVACAIIAEQ